MDIVIRLMKRLDMTIPELHGDRTAKLGDAIQSLANEYASELGIECTLRLTSVPPGEWLLLCKGRVG
jgi:hypothetical protein